MALALLGSNRHRVKTDTISSTVISLWYSLFHVTRCRPYSMEVLHARTHARSLARTHAHTHARTHTYTIRSKISMDPAEVSARRTQPGNPQCQEWQDFVKCLTKPITGRHRAYTIKSGESRQLSDKEDTVMNYDCDTMTPCNVNENRAR